MSTSREEYAARVKELADKKQVQVDKATQLWHLMNPQATETNNK